MIKDKKQFLLLLLVFTFSIIYLMLYVYKMKHTLYISSPDGKLYLSIADNFLKNGHFIQTARHNDINFVVPPGLPIILTMLKLIFDNIIFIVLFQYFVFGLTNVFIFLCCKNLFNNYISGYIAVVFYTIILSLTPECTPSYILTETYTLFIIVLALYILSFKNYNWEKRLKLLIPVLFLGYLIRPVLSVLWIIAMIIMIIMLIVHKLNWKKAVLLIVFPILILALNVFVNYRETGDIILIENYSGIAVYQANNANTSVLEYNSRKINDFVDDYFFKIYDSKDLTMTEKNNLLKEQTKEFISQNWKFVLKNTAIKYYYLFIKNYKYSICIFLAGIIYLSIYDKSKRMIYILFLISFMLLSILTSMGLNISRYSIITLPFYSIINAGVIALIINYTYKFLNNIFLKLKQTI